MCHSTDAGKEEEVEGFISQRAYHRAITLTIPAVVMRVGCPRTSHGCRRTSSATIQHIVAGLLLLQCGRPGLDECTLDAASDLGGKHGTSVEGTRNRLLPRLQHLIQLASSLRIDQRVRIHEGLIQVPSQEQGVRGTDILDDRVNYIQSR